jgi:hypothetical protein
MAFGANDMNIEQLLADPLVRRLMQADRVDPVQFESSLRAAGASLTARTGKAESAPVEPARSGAPLAASFDLRRPKPSYWLRAAASRYPALSAPGRDVCCWSAR